MPTFFELAKRWHSGIQPFFICMNLHELAGFFLVFCFFVFLFFFINLIKAKRMFTYHNYILIEQYKIFHLLNHDAYMSATKHTGRHMVGHMD